jgi:hypothetical protein
LSENLLFLDDIVLVLLGLLVDSYGAIFGWIEALEVRIGVIASGWRLGIDTES